MHDTFNRALTLHGVHHATVEWNVAYNCMGHNFFIEDGCEEHNLIQYNLAMRIKPASSMLNTDMKAAGFWITNTFNTIQHNHAAGGAQVGYWVNPPPSVGHAHKDGHGHFHKCPNFAPVIKWFNNTAHDMGNYGFWIFSDNPKHNYNPSTTDCEKTWPPGHGHFHKGTMWNCLRGAELANGGDNIQLHDFVVANNRLGGLSFKESFSWQHGGEFGQYFNGIVDGVVIGYADETLEELNSTVCTRFGVETPWKPHAAMMVDGVKFFNFDKNEGRSHDFCTAIDACYSSYPFDCGRTTQVFYVLQNYSNIIKICCRYSK